MKLLHVVPWTKSTMWKEENMSGEKKAKSGSCYSLSPSSMVPWRQRPVRGWLSLASTVGTAGHFCGFSQEPTPVMSEKLSSVCRAQAASPSGPFAHSARGCLSPPAPSGTRWNNDKTDRVMLPHKWGIGREWARGMNPLPSQVPLKPEPSIGAE